MTSPHNHLQLIGNLGGDPEMRYTPQGKAVANFNLAVSEGRGDQKTTQWIRIVCWEKTAEAANEYLQKGSRVLVVGKLQQRKYTDKDGNERVAVECIADQYGGLTFLDARQRDDGEQPAPQRQQAAPRGQYADSHSGQPTGRPQPARAAAPPQASLDDELEDFPF